MELKMDFVRWSESFYSFFKSLQFHILRAFMDVNVFEEKSPTDYVGELDKWIEKRLFEFLPKIFDCPILSEETRSSWPPAFNTFWIIDPLDGTNNFLAGLPIFGVIATLIVDGEPEFSVIYLPMDEQSLWCGLYVAAKDKGVFRRLPSGFEPVNVSSQNNLRKAFLLLEGPSNGLSASRYIRDIVSKTERVRNGLSFACSLTRLASGGSWTRGVDIILANGAQPWEAFAGKLFAEAAGGKCTTILGDKVSFGDCGNLLISNGLLHDAALKEISRYSFVG